MLSRHRHIRVPGSEERRIGLVAAVFLAVTALTAGLGGFLVLQHQLERSFAQGLSLMLADQTREVTDAVKSELARARHIAGDPEVVAFASRASPPPSLQKIAPTTSGELNRVVIRRSGGAEELFVTHTPAESTFDLPLEDGATLQWRDELWIRIETPIIQEGAELGVLELDVRLPVLSQALMNGLPIGATAEMRLCSSGPGVIRCLPSRLHPEPLVRPRSSEKRATASELALSGQTGVRQSLRDYRGRSTISAYAPIPDFGLSSVLKIDTDEYYRPIRGQLHLLLPLLIVLVLAGVLLLRSEVTPLVRKLVQSKLDLADANDQLTRREEQTRAIIDSASDAIITVDEGGLIRSFNPTAERLFGWQEHEMLGQSVMLLMPPELRTHHNSIPEYLGLARSTTIGAITVEITGYHREGRSVPLEMAVSEMTLGGRRLFLGIVRDIAQRKHVERMKNDFVSTVSHELRTPLTSIRGSLGLVSAGFAGALPPDAKRLIDIAHSNSERLVHLVNDILDVEKLESGSMSFDLKPIELTALLAQGLEANGGYATQFGVTFELLSVPPGAKVVGDAGRLQQVLSNLLSNAAKFSPRGGRVTVGAERRDGELILAVRDRGPGIPLEFHSRVFDRFAQADASNTRRKGGTGLGLAICKTIVERHNGRIWFESDPGTGSVFFVALREHVAPAATRKASHRQRMLICTEDPTGDLELVRAATSSGFEIDVVSQLDLARERLRSERYSALALDVDATEAQTAALLDDLHPRGSQPPRAQDERSR